MWAAIKKWFSDTFQKVAVVQDKKYPVKDYSRMPSLKFGSKGEFVIVLQERLKELGFFKASLGGNFYEQTLAAVIRFQASYGLVNDGEVGPKTWEILGNPNGLEVNLPVGTRQKPKWKVEAEKYKGKKETDSKFAAFMIPFWKKLFNRNISDITKVGAWCGLAIAVALSGVGYDWQKNGEMARNWKSYGQVIDWKTDGIPEGAIVHINHKYDCDSGSSNHVSMADGDCTAADLLKSGATITLFGGNQRDTWKKSTYSVKEVCNVRWPKEDQKPGRITKSIGCSDGKKDNESTR